MGKTTGIEWTQATWNPWMGCRHVSPGCAHCYAERDMTRYARDFNRIQRAKDATFYAPLNWKEPKLIFTCSWSDFFIEEADGWRADAWDVIRRTPQHIYQVLTKRPERSLACLPHDRPYPWPWPNVWLGTSIENRAYYGRAALLAAVPAAVHFLSVEPLLGPVENLPLGGIQWVIVGGESGPKARPMHPAWARSVRDRCLAKGIAFFFKQWGEWAPLDLCPGRSGEAVCFFPDGRRSTRGIDLMAAALGGRGELELAVSGELMVRAGRYQVPAILDGREWKEMPNAAG